RVRVEGDPQPLAEARAPQEQEAADGGEEVEGEGADDEGVRELLEGAEADVDDPESPDEGHGARGDAARVDAAERFKEEPVARQRDEDPAPREDADHARREAGEEDEGGEGAAAALPEDGGGGVRRDHLAGALRGEDPLRAEGPLVAEVQEEVDE